jgi:hypothetical protein
MIDPGLGERMIVCRDCIRRNGWIVAPEQAKHRRLAGMHLPDRRRNVVAL